MPGIACFDCKIAASSVLYANEKNIYYDPDYLSGLSHALLPFFRQHLSKKLYSATCAFKALNLIMIIRYIPVEVPFSRRINAVFEISVVRRVSGIKALLQSRKSRISVILDFLSKMRSDVFKMHKKLRSLFLKISMAPAFKSLCPNQNLNISRIAIVGIRPCSDLGIRPCAVSVPGHGARALK